MFRVLSERHAALTIYHPLTAVWNSPVPVCLYSKHESLDRFILDYCSLFKEQAVPIFFKWSFQFISSVKNNIAYADIF